MTDEQRAKAERLRVRDGFTTVKYLKGFIEECRCPTVQWMLSSATA
jgi:hypothetical protein